MSKSLYIIFKSLVALTLGFSILSCSGVEIPGGENAAVSDYPVNIIAGAGADTRIAVDDLALTWESDDVLKLAAVATDGSSAVAELNIYKIDESNPSSAAFSGFVSLLAPPQECYFLYPNSSATSAAVTKSTTWLMVAIIPIIISFFTTSPAVTCNLDASCPTTISSGSSTDVGL